MRVDEDIPEKPLPSRGEMFIGAVGIRLNCCNKVVQR